MHLSRCQCAQVHGCLFVFLVPLKRLVPCYFIIDYMLRTHGHACSECGLPQGAGRVCAYCQLCTRLRGGAYADVFFWSSPAQGYSSYVPVELCLHPSACPPRKRTRTRETLR